MDSSYLHCQLLVMQPEGRNVAASVPHVATTREEGLNVMLMTLLRQLMGGGNGGSGGTSKVLQQLLMIVLLALNVKVGVGDWGATQIVQGRSSAFLGSMSSRAKELD